MRKPARNKASARQQVSQFISQPAPVGGWNAWDSLADMKPSDAVVLDNWFPGTNYCEIRGGSSSFATGMSGNARTLMVYNGLNGTNKMFCATDSAIYDVTSGGVVGASVASRTTGKIQWTMFGDGTNEYLITVNGTDAPLYYDGTNWITITGASSPALTGATLANLIAPVVFKGRLFFIEKNTLAFWYLAAGAAGGALTKFDLTGVAQKGGYVVAASSWSVDSGYGPDDRFVIVTSQGEVIVYTGTNPNSSTTWALVGVYQISKPLGRKCLVKYANDLVMLTRQGAYSLTSVLQTGGEDVGKSATKKIQAEFINSASLYGDNYGWTAIHYPAESAVLINVPLAENGTHYQYVMNTLTNAWCRFKAWDAEDFALFNNELYYCQGTKVIKAWTGNSDQGSSIEAYAKSAFSYFGSKGQNKKFRLFRPVLNVTGNLKFLIDLDVDFADNTIAGVAQYNVPTPSLWDSGTWDSSYWSSDYIVVKDWMSPSAWTGYSASAKLKIATNSISVRWMSSDYCFETGNAL